MANFNF